MQLAVGRGQIETKKRKPPTAHRSKKTILVSEKVYLKFRTGDIRNSLANTSKAKKGINYFPLVKLKAGLPKMLI